MKLECLFLDSISIYLDLEVQSTVLFSVASAFTQPLYHCYALWKHTPWSTMSIVVSSERTETLADVCLCVLSPKTPLENTKRYWSMFRLPPCLVIMSAAARYNINRRLCSWSFLSFIPLQFPVSIQVVLHPMMSGSCPKRHDDKWCCLFPSAHTTCRIACIL